MSNNLITPNDVPILVAAIDLFIPAKTPEYSSEEKHQINSFARSAKKKFLNHDSKVHVNEIHATCICLNFLEDIILNANSNIKVNLDLKNDGEKYLSQIEDLIHQFDLQLQSVGIYIFND